MQIRRLLSLLDTEISEDPRVRRLIDLSLKRVLLEGIDVYAEIESSLDVDEHDIRHVGDWLVASVENEAGWLTRLDRFGRPRKLVALKTLSDLVRVADEAMREAARNTPLDEFDPLVDEQHVVDLVDGFYLVKLLTPVALDMESARMGHCIGNGGYDRVLGRSELLSLRSPNGKPHATLHVCPIKSQLTGEVSHVLMEMKGKQNDAVVPKHLARLRPYILSQGYSLVEKPSHTGLVEDENGSLHLIESLPEGLTINGDLDLRNCGKVTLPNGMTVKGDLDLRGCPIDVLPNDLTIERKLLIDFTLVERLPERLWVKRAVHASGTPLSENYGFLYQDDGYVVECEPDDNRIIGYR